MCMTPSALERVNFSEFMETKIIINSSTFLGNSISVGERQLFLHLTGRESYHSLQVSRWNLRAHTI